MYKTLNSSSACSNIAFRMTNKYFQNDKYTSVTVLSTTVIQDKIPTVRVLMSRSGVGGQ